MRITPRIAAVAAVAGLLWLPVPARAEGDLSQAPYRAGFRVIEAFDASRPYFPKGTAGGPSLRGRPLQIALWYPISPESSGDTLSFGAYASLIGREIRFGVPQDEAEAAARAALKRLLAPTYVPALSEEDLDRLWAAPMQAIAHAQAAAGSFPLVLWAKGEDGHAVDHAVLGELLARHGYVLASTPALPAHSRRVGRYDALSVRTQLRDLEFVLQRLAAEPGVDLDRLGVIGWSLGGLPAALLEMRHPDIGALISLDARTGYRNPPEIFRRHPDYELRRATAPRLHLTGTGEPEVDRLKDGSFRNALRYADLYYLVLENLRHRDFNFLWGSVIDASGLRGSWPVPPAEISERIGFLALLFLDSTLGREPSRRKRLLAEVERASSTPGGAASEFRAALPAPPTSDEFLWLLDHSGAAAATAALRRAREHDPGIEVAPADDLLRRCRDHLRRRELDEAAAVARLTLEAHPASALSHYLLAQIAGLQGDGAAAREHYRRCQDALAGDGSLSEAMRERLRRDIDRRLADADGG